MPNAMQRAWFAFSRIVGFIAERIGVIGFALLLVVILCFVFFMGISIVTGLSIGEVITNSHVGETKPEKSDRELIGFGIVMLVVMSLGLSLGHAFKFYLANKHMLEDLKAASSGGFWARWHVTAAEWSRFLEEIKTVVEKSDRTLFIGVIAIGLAGLLYAAFKLPPGGVAALAMMLVPLGGYYVWSNREGRHARAARKGAEVIVGRDFVLANGLHRRLNQLDATESGYRLSRIELVSGDPDYIEMTATAVQPRVLGAISGSRFGAEGAVAGAIAPELTAGAPITVRFPVPAGKGDEAKALVARFEREVIGAGA